MDNMQSTRNKLIRLLANNKDEYISGQLLSEQLNISRSAIWKQMKTLEKAGYQIEGKSKLGYRIISVPDTLNQDTLQWKLETDWLGKKIIHKDTTTSTQFDAHQLVQEDIEHGTVVIADEQTKGKGRMNRIWYSTKQQGVWLSMILKPSILPYQAPQLTLLTATVLADVIHEHTKIRPQIKWPNDILINGKKIAGILTEMQAEQDQIQYVIIGIGINVNHQSDDLPEEIEARATSLRMETNRDWNITQLIQHILLTFEERYETYIDNGFAKIKHKWEGYGYKIGKRIQIKTLQDQWQATFIGIAEDGALLTKTDEGDIQKIYSAEIEWFKEENE